jgi:mRNA-degrading endonuclease YafQ of YafQ-DinJ toxin-antitoxin module
MNLLNKRILRCLNIYNTNLKNENFNLLQNIQNVEILIEKDEIEHARKLLMKTKKRAIEIEQFSTIIKILSVQENLEINTKDHDLVAKSIDLAKSRRKYIDKIQNYFDYKNLKLALFDIQYKLNGKAENPEDYAVYLNNPLLKNRENALSCKAEELFLFCNGIAHGYSGDYKNAIKYTMEQIVLLSKNRDIFSKEDYIKAINNHILGLFDLDSYVETEKFLLQFTKFKEENHLVDQVPFYYNYLYLQLYIYSDNNAKLKEFITKSYNEILFYNDHISPSQCNEWFQFLMSGAVHLKDYNFAINIYTDWVNYGILSFIVIQAKLLRCICFYEQKKHYVLLSENETMYKYILKNKNLHTVYKAFYKFFKKLGQDDSVSDKLFEEFYLHILTIPGAEKELKQIDVLYWLRGKIK